MKKVSGIYCIENTVNHKKYVGQSDDVYRRMADHIRRLNKEEPGNRYLQDSWREYGEASFLMYVLTTCEVGELNDMEVFYISNLSSKYPKGYNLTDGGDGCSGKIIKDSTRHLLSQIQTLHNSFLGKNHTDIARRKISIAGIGNKRSEGKVNRQGRKPHNKGGFVGVRKVKNKWESRITHNKTLISLGRYESPDVAARVYDTYARLYYGKSAKTNFR